MMSQSTKGLLLFLVGCIGTRLAFALLARQRTDLLPYLAVLALLPAIGFFAIYLTRSRKTGGEVFGKPIWWDHLRPVHGALYLAFAAMAWRRDPNAWLILLADVTFGLTAFTLHRIGV